MRNLLALLAITPLLALEYAHKPADPPPTGWPLTAEEAAFIAKPEFERRPGREINQHLPQLWPAVPSAGFFGGDAWLKLHEAHVKTVQANQGPVDVLLVGDSITIQWGTSWSKHFPDRKAVNIGIGGDKTQNVLWRIDHGGVAGLQPRLVVLLIGNNNMFYTRETGVAAAAQGIKACLENLRAKFPEAELVVATIFPAHAPGHAFYEDIKQTNAAFRAMQLERDPKVHVIDLWPEMLEADGSLRRGLFHADNIHLTQGDGYAFFAAQLQPVVARLLR